VLIGIDVGGTYTDGILVEGGAVLHFVKHPTDASDLEGTLLGVLDELLSRRNDGEIERIVLSTTLVTNLLATGRGERTALLLMPGPGLPFSAYKIGTDTFFLKGSVDFRGREIEKQDQAEIERTLEDVAHRGIHRVAVAGKFSNRNDVHERFVKNFIEARYPHMYVCTSNDVSGRLNFPRRAATCYYTAMTAKEWNVFADGILAAVKARVPGCALHILKADGGTMTIESSRQRPCETVFSGPAASTMGGTALSREAVNSVVVDIGGTTSDISLLIEGQPLYASKGASIGGHFTHIHAFAVNSIPLGGDNTIIGEMGALQLGPRVGPAACFGGNSPTVTDAFAVLLGSAIGNFEASRTAIEGISEQLSKTVDSLCNNVADRVIQSLRSAIEEMFHQWEDEPAYRVWEVVNRKKFVLHQVIGIGAAAPLVIPALAEKLGVPFLLHRLSPVANALGAAVARPTLEVQVHVDTQNSRYVVSPGGARGTVNKQRFTMEDARTLARQAIERIGRERGLSAYTAEAAIYFEEQFNVIRGRDLSGKLFDVGIQITPGFVHGYKGVAR
jgi:N-methylhydantoinase A